MGVQISAKPDSGFDDPIGMLTDCHRRIEQFLKILATVVERAEGRNLTGEEATAVQSALRYFRAGYTGSGSCGHRGHRRGVSRTARVTTRPHFCYQTRFAASEEV